MRPLGIEFISVFGLPPVEFVGLAADLGCQHVSMTLQPIDYNPHGYPIWTLRDKALRREMVAAMADRGISISLGEGFVVFPDRDVRDYAADFDAIGELGVRRINTLSFDPDIARSVEQIGALADMAASRGIETLVEFTPSKKIRNLSVALDVVRQADRPNLKVMVDTMHLMRSGSWPAKKGDLDSALVGYVQLCDVPLESRFDDYVEEAMYQRMTPGTGELPLRDILAALPRDLPVGLEVPLRSQAELGLGPYERLKPCVEAARTLLAEAG